MADVAQNVKTTAETKRAPTLYFIIVFKLAKGALALLLAFGVYKLAGKDLQGLFDRLLRFIHLDPENRFLSDVGDHLDDITPANVRWVATGTFLYSLFSLVEGIGLMFRVPWAGWLTIGESAFFIPIEVFELVHHHELMKRGVLEHPVPGFYWKVGMILGLNILILWYLFQNRARLFKHH
ncbi:MAG TPA: DUF2127 domain-containing protein [Verrucomicrobiae bacterium]|jgi:uncharacterized membrane protein (DUF2068 family)|nr:DUF2127 domain-containing protein [Verrucomicrobiae bacterium]